MRKMLSVIALAVCMVFLLSGCNLKEKISENITEGILEKASGGEADVEINGDDVSFSSEEGEWSVDGEDGMTFEGEDGSVMASGGEYEWPTDQAAAYLPEFDKGTVVYILNGPDTCMLMLEGVELDDYKDYKEEIIDAGYTDEKFESSAEDLELYSGKSSDGVAVSISVMPIEKTFQVTVDASGKQ